MKRYKSSSFIGMFLMALLACMLAACTSQSTDTSNNIPPAPSNTHSATPSSTVVLQNPGDPILSIRMLDHSKGWALTDQDILFTSDGGQEWKKVTPAGSTLTKYITGDFMNDQYAWVVSTAAEIDNTVNVWRTSDGGQHWQSSTISVNQGSVIDYPHFLTTQEGFLELGTFGGPGAGSEAVGIFHTINGGQSWTEVSDTEHPGELPHGGLKSGISFKDVHNGWATGEDASSTPWLYATHDGGHTWSLQSLPPAVTNPTATVHYTLTPPVFFGNTDFLPAHVSGHFSSDATSDANVMMLYKSTNGGTTWLAEASRMTTFASNDLYIADINHAWANDESGTFYGTTDGGEHWQTLNNTVDIIYALSFTDASYGWGLTNTKLLHTTDGGSTWNQISYHIIA